jgi:hypothetical protein
MKKLHEFFIFFETHRMYLPESVCSLLDKFIQDVTGPVTHFAVEIQQPAESTLIERLNAWVKAFESFEKDKDIQAARKALETEFRRILGGIE